MLPPDTQAMLLLCGTLGQNPHSGPAPLTLGEYNELEIWLGENKMRPGDLLSNLGYGRVQQISGVNLNKDRLYALLARGEMLALAVGKWRSERVWAIGRNDIRYPNRLTKRLKQLAFQFLSAIPEMFLKATASCSLKERSLFLKSSGRI